MALSYKNDEDQDQRLNPASDTARDLYRQEQSGYDREFDNIAANFDNTADTSTENDNITKTKNIDNAKDQEERGGWANNYSGNKQPSEGRLKGLKKKGPIGLILAILAFSGTSIFILFSPGILIVQLKETMVNKFNDQLATMEIRSTAMIKKKFSGTTSGVCTTKLSIRCKFNTMSDRQLKKLEQAGIKVNKSGETIVRGRAKIASLEFNGKTIRAADLVSELKANPAFRSAMMRGYNPKLAGFADSISVKVREKLGITKDKNIKGSTKEEMEKSLRDASSGNLAAEADAKVTSRDVDGETKYFDENNNEIPKEEYDTRIRESSGLKGEFSARKALTETGEEAAKGTLKGALTVTALGLGAVDSACTGYRLIRTVGFAAKYLGALQLLRYAHTFMNTADSIKAGDATPEQVEFVGNILTSTNSIGQSATDSYGYKYAAYGDVAAMPRSDNITAESVGANNNNIQLSDQQKQQVLVNDETTKYINGQLVTHNLLSNVINLVGSGGTTTAAADSTCSFVKSGWGQAIVIGGALVGAVAAFFSGGATLTWGAAAQVAVSVAISLAIAMLTPKLIDMAAGTMINGKENGNQAGNAITSGMGAYNDQNAQARGIPALKKEDAVQYSQLTYETEAQYAAVDRYEKSPFDATSPNTFLGSIASRVVPYTAKVNSVASGISAISGLTASALTGLLPSVGAADPAAQYNECQDDDYAQKDLAVDPFCNIRRGMSAQVLATDSDTVLDYMINNGYINEDTGEPTSSDNDYAKYIEHCMNRSVSIGGYTDDDDDDGSECIQGNSTGATEEKYNMFRLFYIDFSINDGMDNGEVSRGTSTQSATPTISGDAKALALQVADNANIAFVNEQTREQLKIFGNGGQVFDSCGKPMTVSKYLLGALQANSTKYKILINNIGFKQDRDMCESGTYQHPKGTAVDLNNIQIIGGASTGGSINLPGSDLAIVNQYATDFLAALPNNRGGVGQKQWGVNPTFPPGSVALNGSHLFEDAPNHLHIDARNRLDLNDTE